MTEEQLAALGDPATTRLTAAEKAALRFAEGVAGDANGIPDAVYEELRRHYDEAQVWEIALVAGIFCYFNRVNNALRTDITVYPAR
ncbi:MAG: hypothetical protein HZA54_19445 [Planctomycetes bacterium]|nr:hypothetical protein [Planctomycetota bacterium]